MLWLVALYFAEPSANTKSSALVTLLRLCDTLEISLRASRAANDTRCNRKKG